ncbi:MAG: hypothetical protein KDJ52_23465 [Anaerolineae bacterium]|nr:hypothetical protein [Anaerolineae bacterium]
MPTIQAWQHIYSNVEKEQSPQGRGGFQTLFYSQGLTEAEVEEMEGHLLYFTSAVEPVKRLFFTISTGKSAVAQIVPISATDKYGRGGRYLAHSVVFAADAMADFEADPFRVFRQCLFIDTIDDALDQGDFATGRIPMVELDLSRQFAKEVEAAKKWSATEHKTLALLALRAHQQAAARNAITVVGQSNQIEEALEAAFLGVPLIWRTRCSFDSYFYRCNLVATYYWAIGLPEAPVSIKFAQVDAASRNVKGELPNGPVTAYERWVLTAIETRKLDDLARQRDIALTVGEWLDGREYDLDQLSKASPDLITSVFKASPESVKAALQRQVAQKLPTELTRRAADYIFAANSGIDLYRQLRQGFEINELLDALYASYETDHFQSPARSEVKALAKTLDMAEHKMLRLFLAYWDNPKKTLSEALQWSDEEDYRRFVEISNRMELVDPLRLIVPGKGDLYLDIYPPQRDPNLHELAEALVGAGETACLTRLSPFVPRQSRRNLHRLNKLVEDTPATPVDFQKAVQNAIQALPPEKGITGMVKSVVNRLLHRTNKPSRPKK